MKRGIKDMKQGDQMKRGIKDWLARAHESAHGPCVFCRIAELETQLETLSVRLTRLETKRGPQGHEAGDPGVPGVDPAARPNL